MPFGLAAMMRSARGVDLQVVRVGHDAQDVAEGVDHRGGDETVPASGIG